MACAGNVLLTSSADTAHGFGVKISDFGMCRKLDIQSKIATKTTGTVTYMPPEVLSEGMVSKVGNFHLQPRFWGFTLGLQGCEIW